MQKVLITMLFIPLVDSFRDIQAVHLEPPLHGPNKRSIGVFKKISLVESRLEDL